MYIPEIVTENYCLFWGQGTQFSNWEYSPMLWDTFKFQNAELVFMYEKAKLFKDAEALEEILEVNEKMNNTDQARTAKGIGRLVEGFSEEVWKEHRENIMFNILLEKTKQNKKVQEALMKYKHLEFVEASPYDKIWGIGLQPENPLARNKENWQGLNLLGKAWNKVQRYFEVN